MLILENFAPRAQKPDLEFGSSRGDKESDVRIIWEVETQIPFYL